MNKAITPKSILLLALSGLILGACISALSTPTAFWEGLPGAALLCALILAALYAAWRWAGGGRALAWMVVLAFVLRLGVGVFLTHGLPVWGYDNENQRAGYIFPDAYQRDQQAWQIAQSGDSILTAFGSNLVSDQYGGLLALSALVYRLFSPDAHRQLLMIVFGAGFAALGLPFFRKTVRSRWGDRTALTGGWILALYPESILLGSSQMREPFLIGLIAIAFWGMLAWREKKKVGLIALVLGVAGLLLFSWKIAVPAAMILLGWYLLDRPTSGEKPIRRFAAWAGILAGAVVVIGLTAWWLKVTVLYEANLTLTGSGLVQAIVYGIGKQWLVPFVTIYGLFQPVLPAAIGDPAAWLAQTISIVRAAGWWALVPLLIYFPLAAWHSNDSRQRRLLAWTGLVVWGWIFISSLRAGGDMWDNPRYRTIFLVWIALIAGWTWDWALSRKDAWLACLYAIEGVFVLIVARWYIARRFTNVPQVSYPMMLVIFILCSGLILAWGWWQNRRMRQPA